MNNSPPHHSVFGREVRLSCCLRAALSVVLLIGSIGSSAYGQGEAQAIITVSEHTTRFAEPLDAQGFVDFANAVNLKLRGDITPETNAAVPLYQAFGSHPERGLLTDEFYRQLGMDTPATDGPFLAELGYYLKMNDDVPEEERSGPGIGKLYDRMMKAPWQADDLPTVAKWLKSIEAPMQLVTDGMNRSKYFLPLVPGVAEDGQTGLMINALLPGVQLSREVARALIARAMWRLGEGQTLDAWSDLRTCHRLGRLIAQGPTLIERLVGIAIETIAMKAEVLFLEHVSPKGGLLAIIKKDLAELPERGTMADAVDICERAMFLDVVQTWAAGRQAAIQGVLGNQDDPTVKMLTRLISSSIQWNDVMRNGNRWYDSMVMAMRKPGFANRLEAYERIDVELKALAVQTSDPAQLLKLLLPGQAGTVATKQIGNILVSLLLPAVSQAQKAEDQANQLFANLQVALALVEWKGQTGEWPDSLHGLVPRVLSEVPSDLFSDEPLIYRREGDGFVLYSIGVNQKDDESRSYDDQPAADDLVIRIPVARQPE